MKVLVDENIPRITVQELRRLGHEVLDLRGTPDEGLPDDRLWARAQLERRLLIATDIGFRHHRHETHAGILIVRLRLPNQQKIHVRVMRAMLQTNELEWPGRLVIVRDTVQAVHA